MTMLCPVGVKDELFSALCRAGSTAFDRRFYALSAIDTVFRRSFNSNGPPDQFLPIPYQTFLDAIPNRQAAWAKRVVSDGRLLPPVIEWDKEYWFDPDPEVKGECMNYRPAAACRESGIEAVAVWEYKLGKKLKRAAEVSRDEAVKRYRDDPDDLINHIERNALRAELVGLPEHLTADPIVDHFTGVRPHWCHPCPMGRVHHHVGNCPSALREYLRFTGYGSPLALLDIANSQPLLLSLVVDLIFARGFPATAGEGGHQGQGRTRGAGRGTTTHPATAPHTAVRFSPDRSVRVGAFAERCLSGEVYDWVATHARLAGDERYDVGLAKHEYMVCAYGDCRMTDNTFGRTVRRLDPEFYAKLVAAKTLYPNGLLAKYMQRIEAEVMIGEVARRLMLEHRDEPFVPIHDAFLCLPEFVPVVQRIIEEAWLARFGVVPIIRPKFF